MRKDELLVTTPRPPLLNVPGMRAVEQTTSILFLVYTLALGVPVCLLLLAFLFIDLPPILTLLTLFLGGSLLSITWVSRGHEWARLLVGVSAGMAFLLTCTLLPFIAQEIEHPLPLYSILGGYLVIFGGVAYRLLLHAGTRHYLSVIRRSHPIRTLAFGTWEIAPSDSSRVLCNPTPDDLDKELLGVDLCHIAIHTQSANPMHIESCLMYLLTTLGQCYLHTYVTVDLYGDATQLPPNIRNTLANCCKSVRIQ